MTDFLDDRQRAMLAEMGVTVWERINEATAARPAATLSPGQVNHAVTPIKVPRPANEPVLTPATKTNPSLAHASKADARDTRRDEWVEASPRVLTEWVDLTDLDEQQLRETARTCQDCGLCASRQASVWGQSLGATYKTEATPRPMVLIITDPPDEAEEATGLPLGGSESAAGSLLNAMLEAAGWMTGIPSCGVFVTPVTKCKVPAGYKLTNTELSACRRYLAQQITLLQPQLIFTLGRVAAQALLAPMQEGHSARPLGQLRGMVHEVQGHAWVASLAPQYLLRNPLEKAKAWDDLCLAMAHLANTKINR